ncbi:hypothetical protein ASE75_05255 [Sphingomonas sp. Leaf17]|uniref:hypothetical protein n=1 Tax=Sphingomonas sp. Leaf17 TaxID=1735683 RepID=UPI0006F3ED6C|nr:hypothetical protein [Sphingomonas sp. Leaf17]KQM65653.1 hypothetical protein ASE75_05255 [Sphingomonas sp. Leaf17]
MKFVSMIAAGLVAITGIAPATVSAAPMAAPLVAAVSGAPMLQDRVVRQRTVVRRNGTVVRRTTRQTRGYGYRGRRPVVRQRTVCRNVYRGNRRIRTCRTIRR